MTLRELYNLFAQSEFYDWNYIPVDTYPNPALSMLSGTQKDGWITRNYRHFASFKSDLSITMAWGYETGEKETGEWVKCNGNDDSGYMAIVDIFTIGALVFRSYYVITDGGRCYLPITHGNDDEKVVAQQYSDFIEKLDEITGRRSGNYDDYFAITGIRKVEEFWLHD